jgi:hypothetical protein
MFVDVFILYFFTSTINVSLISVSELDYNSYMLVCYLCFAILYEHWKFEKL